MLSPEVGWLLLPLLQLREANRGAPAPFGGAAGLRRLRWPAGRREVAETLSLLLAGGVGRRLGPRVSRGRCPAAALRRRRRGIRSSRALPRLGGAALRRRRRARGGGSPGVEPYVQESAGGGLSSSVTAARSGFVLGLGCFDSCGCCGWLVSGSTSTSPRHVSTARFDPWSEELGRVPDRRSFIGVSIPAFASGGYCGSFQSFHAMGFLQI